VRSPNAIKIVTRGGYIRITELTKNVFFVLIGSAITALGLQLFLIPNHLLDGGITGISIVSAYLTKLPLAPFLILFNIPFVYLGYKKFGRQFAALSIIGISALALTTLAIHSGAGFTDQPILAAVFGGIFVGVGVGLVVRYGGIIDGTDTIAVIIDRVTFFSVGEAIMVINGTIITISGFIFGWENAMYSIIAYFVAHKAIDVTVEGLNEDRSVWVVSMNVRAIGKIINEVTNEPVTYIKESDPDHREPHGVLLSVITRFEEQKVKSAIRRIDPDAFIVIGNVHEAIGKDTLVS